MSERSRAELETLITSRRAEFGPLVERYNHLLERRLELDTELAALKPKVDAYSVGNNDLDWEYFRRLQRDGALPSLPVVRMIVAGEGGRRFLVPETTDTEGEDDDGRDDSDFEVGEKG